MQREASSFHRDLRQFEFLHLIDIDPNSSRAHKRARGRQKSALSPFHGHNCEGDAESDDDEDAFTLDVRGNGCARCARAPDHLASCIGGDGHDAESMPKAAVLLSC
jgi:hypothetical protein